MSDLNTAQSAAKFGSLEMRSISEGERAMQRKIGVGLVLFALALMCYLLGTVMFGLSSLDQILITAGFGAVAGLIGVFLLVSDSIEGHFSPGAVAVEFMDDLRDDLVDLGEFRPTMTLVETGITLLSVPVFLGLILIYQKLGAEWHGISVIFIGVVASAIVGWLVYCTGWFHDKSFDTPTWVYAVAAVGFVLSIGAGLYFAEPVSRQKVATSSGASATWTPPTTESNYDEGTRGRVILNNLTGGTRYYGSSSSFSMPACEGEECGYAILAIILILLVLAVIVASALIPHFWVVGGMLLLTIMVMISLQELRQRPWGGYRY